MEPHEYQTFYEFEDHYWWFRGLRKMIIQSLDALALPPKSRVLDVGCGTGGTLAALIPKFQIQGFAFDISEHAMPFLKKRHLNHVGVGSVNAIPCKSEIFEAVLCIDVFESKSVEVETALLELNRVLKKSGILLMIVPAYEWLKSSEHHAAVHASRRYNRRQVKFLLQNAGFKVKRTTYCFALIFPLIAIYRFMLKLKPKPDHKTAPRSELKHLPEVIQSILTGIVLIENWLLRYINFGWGSSILAIAEKP